MAKRIAETDLILNPDGSVYHLNLLPHHINDTVIMVGDPNRVYQVSRHFDDIEFEINHREFITHAGRYRGRKLTVISTGIGTDNIEICLTEIDALVNVDLATRQEKADKKRISIIRIGTSGALQHDISVGTHLVSEYAIGFDNLMQFYSLPQNEFEMKIAADLQRHLKIGFLPYVVKGSEKLQRQIGFDMVIGNTITAPGFYAPQGRRLRIPIKHPGLPELLNNYRNGDDSFRLTNFEMESAGYYALGRLLGHEVLSVNAILANRMTNEFAPNPSEIVNSLIVKVLDRITG